MAKLRVFGVLNHLSHQHEMLKMVNKYDIKFSYLENNVRRWSRFSARPDPATLYSKDQFEWVTHYEPGKYDVAILHTDQQHTDPRIGKGWLYEDLNSIIKDIPKIVINHGTPMWDEYYTEDVVINGGTAHTMKGPVQIKGMKEKIGDNFMIVNSYESVERWGWGYPLIHGLDPDEWFDLPKEPRVVLSLSPGGLDKYYNRELITAIKGAVKEKTGLDVAHIQVNVKFEQDNFYQYRNFIGSSLINISPYKDSPMPRSRTEAMLSGACILTSRYHGAEDFIEHGVDGFVVPDNPLSYANAIHHLINGSYKDAVEIGQRGKEKAKKLFNLDRYHKELHNIIIQVANGKKPEWDGKRIWDKDMV